MIEENVEAVVISRIESALEGDIRQNNIDIHDLELQIKELEKQKYAKKQINKCLEYHLNMIHQTMEQEQMIRDKNLSNLQLTEELKQTGLMA